MTSKNSLKIARTLSEVQVEKNANVTVVHSTPYGRGRGGFGVALNLEGIKRH